MIETQITVQSTERLVQQLEIMQRELDRCQVKYAELNDKNWKQWEELSAHKQLLHERYDNPSEFFKSLHRQLSKFNTDLDDFIDSYNNQGRPMMHDSHYKECQKLIDVLNAYLALPA